MRLWHYKLLPFLPKSQLLAQWRELNSIFKKQDKHILINYVYEYPKEHLLVYTIKYLDEFFHRYNRYPNLENFVSYFGKDRTRTSKIDCPFPNHHNDRYLLQCFYNLQEKFDRGQKDFSKDKYDALEHLVLG